MRTLTLTSPYMRGPDVRKVQARLRGVAIDDVFGPATASAVARWRWRTGFAQSIPALGPEGQRILLGIDPLPLAYRARAKLRAAQPAPPIGVGSAAVEIMVGWARAGVDENPARSNIVPELARIARDQGLAEWYQRMGWPWCAFSAFLAALQVGGKSATLGLKKGAFNALYCPDILTQATAGRHGMQVVGKAAAKRGDLALFDFDGGGVVDHIGRILGPPANGIARTVEGNTSPGDGGSQTNGGGVYLRERPLATIRAFVRDS